MFVQIAGRAGLAGGPDDVAELLGPVGDPGEDRRHADAGLDPGVDELLQRLEPLARVRGRRLGLAPDLVVERRDRERHRDVGAAGGLDEDVDVADDHRAARDDAERVAGLGSASRQARVRR